MKTITTILILTMMVTTAHAAGGNKVKDANGKTVGRAAIVDGTLSTDEILVYYRKKKGWVKVRQNFDGSQSFNTTQLWYDDIGCTGDTYIDAGGGSEFVPLIRHLMVGFDRRLYNRRDNEPITSPITIKSSMLVVDSFNCDEESFVPFNGAYKLEPIGKFKHPLPFKMR